MATTHGSAKESGKADDQHKSGSQPRSAQGEKGVTQDQVGSGKKNDPNNFANDRERAAAAGRKGGKSSHN